MLLKAVFRRVGRVKGSPPSGSAVWGLSRPRPGGQVRSLPLGFREVAGAGEGPLAGAVGLEEGQTLLGSSHLPPAL